MEIIFEFITIGAITRVAAVDPATGIEAIIQGPSNYGNETLKRNAARKLHYLIEKERKAKSRS